jgi:hypothetical protein
VVEERESERARASERRERETTRRRKFSAVFCKHSSLEFFLELLDCCCGCCFEDSLLEDRKICKFSFQQMFCGEFWFFLCAYYLFCRE